MISSAFIKSDNILYFKRGSEITPQDLLLTIKEIDQNYRNNNRLYIIEDIRQSFAKLAIEIEEIPIIINELKKHICNYKEVRCAVIVNTPIDTVLSFLYEDLSKDLENYKYKTFSTTEAATKWLKQGFYKKYQA